ncbi:MULTISPECIES: TlpA disulfide reductase family protein [unclassified Sphingobacterium]|uniref:TlpA family protein disulfide reductase n=1 Tax=unclassified Sphingobacterium TaxID=2609468 RepID=UPI0020C27980|nr:MULTISPECIES: TlpA disulfide reductase family protein [unclassified Sphingobacterium]
MKNFYWGRRELSKKIYRLEPTALNFQICSLRTFITLVLAFQLLLFSKSVLAQSPNPEAVAGSGNPPSTVIVGQKVPTDFWNQKHTIYEDGKTRVITLKEFKGKVLILDFWSVSCGNCIFHQKAISYFKEKFPEHLEVIMVNPLRTKDSLSHITAFEDKFRQEYFPNGFRSIILDKELTNLFAVRAFPTYVWITPGGMVQTITFWNFLNKDAAMPFHKGKGL